MKNQKRRNKPVVPGKQTEVELDNLSGQKEAEFRLGFDQSPVGTALLHVGSGRFARANEAFCRFTGYSAEELAELTFLGITHPDDLPISEEQTKQLLNGRTEGFEIDKRYIRKDGSVAWGHLSVQMVRDGSGRALYTLAIVQDITERKKAERRLRESEEAMKSFFNATNDIACLISTDGTIVIANDVLAQRVGRQAHDLVGQNLFDFFPEEIARYRRSGARKVVESRRPGKFEDASVEGRYFETSVYPVFDADGKVIRLAVYAKDVTEAKQASRALAESEARFGQLFDSVNDGIAVRDAETFELLDANQRFCEMWGYTLEELKALPFGSLGAYESTDERRARLIAYYAQATKGNPSLIQWAAGRKDGSIFWVELNSTKITISNRECLLAVARDITGRKLAEEKIKSSLKEKEVLLKEIHHRVKNNLQIVSSLLYLQASRTEHPGAISALRESRARIKSIALIHERLYASPDLASVDMRTYTRNLVSDLRRSHRTEESSVQLRLNIEDIPLGITEAIPCGLIINELISNALKHAFPEGIGGDVTIQLFRGEANRITLTVDDNGVGFPEHVDFRKSPSLGLTLVNSLVEQLSGTIELDRRGGTGFTITFGTNAP
jgi:PAS domain S-box-containing protein